MPEVTDADQRGARDGAHHKIVALAVDGYASRKNKVAKTLAPDLHAQAAAGKDVFYFCILFKVIHQQMSKI
ncbi:hypothetical protein AWI22_08855 [Enterobacter bugandensis]|nr:hypothetical protein AWI22_08855 [Enterobacter bugandensis]